MSDIDATVEHVVENQIELVNEHGPDSADAAGSPMFVIENAVENVRARLDAGEIPDEKIHELVEKEYRREIGVKAR